MSAKTSKPIGVGIAGLGRSGWGIHAATLKEHPGQFRIAAVSDPDAGRRAEAEQAFGCRAHDSFEALVQDADVELVVVASPNPLHAEHSIAAMQAGRDVVCEKPFALDSAEADRVIAASKQTGRVIAPFQNKRYEPAFRKIQEVIASGVLGRIVLIRIAAHSFSRRWDWQTLQEYGGGMLNNHGPHLIDQALELFGDAEPKVFCKLDRALTSGDADDHAKIILQAEGAPTIDVEISAACAFGQEPWLVMGTRGGLHGNAKKIEWKYVDFDQMPPRPVTRIPTPDRSYNREALDWQTGSWELDAANTVSMSSAFYLDVHKTLRDGAPLVVTPQSVRRQIALLETCRKLSPLEAGVMSGGMAE